VAQGAIGVDENDSIEAVGHVPLEEQRDIANDQSVAALPRAFDELRAQSLDLWMDDLVELLELFLISEDDAPQCGSIEVAVGGEHRLSPALDDLLEGGRAKLDGAARQHVGVDDGRPALGEHLGDCRFTASDVPRESNEQHRGFLR
jgi:hypothetical protein